ncbi:hypothetical protein ATY41_10045 [Leifsonia xyli subsp. xyli]|uniref:H+ antiporter-3 of the major facilitator superfamily (MFS) n=2 Tax=Leifsonia xyli subsp. xyli TaxID=59736 RepID=Q6AG78_LEIXX|nr:MFS transporter [Leifsonia xyli]AAT88617.1 H+ antiporter-3 of the major facilitator superfamily (MFS) [Leifsonia xyli subsp. xyli str. CTCB07]ODA90564.1 hypothetical protein ATY41_10045 [Leifsonia xyli subsp. xyli]
MNTTAPEPDAGASLASTDFRVLLASRIFSAMASGLTWVLLSLWVFAQTESPFLTGLMSATNVVPYIVFGILAGATVDRGTPSAVIAAMEFVNCAALAVVPILTLTGTTAIWPLFLVAAVSSTAYVWFDVSSSAIVPRIVPGRDLALANSRLWLISTLVSVAAAPLAFTMLNTFGLGTSFGILAALYAISGFVLTRLKALNPVAPSVGSRLQQLVEGLRFSVVEPTIRFFMTTSIGMGISGGAVYGMLIVFSSDALGLASTDLHISLIVGASGLGALIGALATPRLERWSTLRMVRVLLLANVALMFLFTRSPNWLIAGVAVLAWNATQTSLMVLSIAARQRVTPLHLQGRVNSAGRTVAWGSVLVGTFVCGSLASGLGVRTALLVLVVPVTASFVIALILRFPRLAA